MTSIDTAFADGPFGSSSIAEAASDSPEPEAKETPAESSEQPREASAKDEPAKTDKPADEGRDGQGEDDELGLGEAEPNLDNLRKALKTERSLSKKQRADIKATVDRLEQIEAHNRNLAAQIAALKPQEQKPKPESAEDGPDFFAQPEDFVQQAVAKRLAPVSEIVQAQALQFQRSRIIDAEEALVEHVADGRENIDQFKALAANDPSLREQFAAVVEGRHPHYRNPAKFAYEYAKEYRRVTEALDPDALRAKIRAEVEAELRGESGESEKQEQPRRTPLTLAGHRGRGASVSSASAAHLPVEKTFAF